MLGTQNQNAVTETSNRRMSEVEIGDVLFRVEYGNKLRITTIQGNREHEIVSCVTSTEQRGQGIRVNLDKNGPITLSDNMWLLDFERRVVHVEVLPEVPSAAAKRKKR